MAIGKKGNSYAINSESIPNNKLPFAAPKKTNTRSLDNFNSTKKTAAKTVVVEPKESIEKTNEKPESAELIDVSTESPVEIKIQEEPTKVQETAETEKVETIVEEKATLVSKLTSTEINSQNSLDKYTGIRKNTTFAFCDKNDISYIKIKANRLGSTYQDFLAQILLENIEAIKNDSFDYTEHTYQKTKTGLKNPVNDRFALREDFLADIKQAAAIVGMKRSAFVAMCVHKARKNDPNPAWDN